MAYFSLCIVAQNGDTWDITERVSALTWSGSIKQVARQLDVTLVAPNDASLPDLPTDLANEMRLWAGAATRFWGNIVTREKATGASTMDVTALDHGWSLSGNEGWYSFNGVRPETAVRSLCADFGIPVGTLAVPGVTVSRKFPGVALSEIVDTLYTMAGEQNGKRYLSRFNGLGQLEVVEKPETAVLEIAPGHNLQSQRVTEDITNLCNRVAIYTDTGQLVRTMDGEDGISFVFQHIITQKDGTDAGAEAKAYLEDNGLKQTVTVECMGDPVLISGNAVMLRDNATGTVGLFWIDSDTHTWKNGQYFCRLSLNFRNIMHNVNAGQEVSR